MKATGIVRKVDGLGRFVLPIELRRTLGIDIGDPIEVFADGDSVILRKYRRNEDKAHQIAQLREVIECSDNHHVHQLINDAIEFIEKA